jgi:serine/threonine protein kinase
MDFEIGDIIDAKYKMIGLCSNSGGMGNIIFVETIKSSSKKFPFKIVLKYCKLKGAKDKMRFSREVRYLSKFSKDPYIIQILDYNYGYDPPYFVMKYYPENDLKKVDKKIRSDLVFQEKIFHQMLDCIEALHKKNCRHRDIKPENFLLDNGKMVVSDLGLSKEVGSGTTFTKGSEYSGTEAYIPPEFLKVGFKEATEASDIFMLGKSFYALLTNSEPYYITKEGINPLIIDVIDKCCNYEKEKRYQSISELRDSLRFAYDVILGRTQGVGKAQKKLEQIKTNIENGVEENSEEITVFLDILGMISYDDQRKILKELPTSFYSILAKKQYEYKTENFLEIYRTFAEDAVKIFSYAEVVAKNMKFIFDKSKNKRNRSLALEIACICAYKANRFAAMKTCHDMIYSIYDYELGYLVAAMLTRNKENIFTIEANLCNSEKIKNALWIIQEKV